MKLKYKLMLGQFLVGGIFSAFLYWAWDSTEGKSFDLVKFLMRVVIFGFGMVLAFYVGGLGDRKKQKSTK